jgi:hypothetical protein
VWIAPRSSFFRLVVPPLLPGVVGSYPVWVFGSPAMCYRREPGVQDFDTFINFAKKDMLDNVRGNLFVHAYIAIMIRNIIQMIC